MAKNIKIKNNVTVVKNSEESIKIEQNVTMVDSPKSDPLVLFDFVETSPKDSKIGSLAKVVQNKDGSHSLKLNLQDKLTDLPKDFDKTALDILSKASLDIVTPPASISLKQRGTEIVVSITAKDQQPCTFTINASSIKLQYKDEKGDDNCAILNLDPEKSKIDFTMQRKVVEDMLSGDPLYTKHKILATNSDSAIPPPIMYMYFSEMKENSSITFGDYVLVRAKFDASENINSNMVMVHRKDKGDNLIFTGGAFKKVSGYFYQHDQDGKQGLVIATSGSTKPYYKIPLIEDGDTQENKDSFNAAIKLMLENTSMTYNDPRIEQNSPEVKGQELKNSDIKAMYDEKDEYTPLSFQEDIREYSNHSFNYKKPSVRQLSINENLGERDDDDTPYEKITILNLSTKQVNQYNNTTISNIQLKPTHITNVTNIYNTYNIVSGVNEEIINRLTSIDGRLATATDQNNTIIEQMKQSTQTLKDISSQMDGTNAELVTLSKKVSNIDTTTKESAETLKSTKTELENMKKDINEKMERMEKALQDIKNVSKGKETDFTDIVTVINLMRTQMSDQLEQINKSIKDIDEKIDKLNKTPTQNPDLEPLFKLVEGIKELLAKSPTQEDMQKILQDFKTLNEALNKFLKDGIEIKGLDALEKAVLGISEQIEKLNLDESKIIETLNDCTDRLGKQFEGINKLLESLSSDNKFIQETLETISTEINNININLEDLDKKPENVNNINIAIKNISAQIVAINNILKTSDPKPVNLEEIKAELENLNKIVDEMFQAVKNLMKANAPIRQTQLLEQISAQMGELLGLVRGSGGGGSGDGGSGDGGGGSGGGPGDGGGTRVLGDPPPQPGDGEREGENNEGGNNPPPPPTGNPQEERQPDNRRRRTRLERGPRIPGERREFKDTAEAVGNTMMGVGIWLGICCMIPGINVIAAFIALGLVIGGGLLNTFADKIAFTPYTRAMNRVQEYEQEEADNAEFKENFIENEHILENYHAQSEEKIAVLNNMMSADPEHGGNSVARTFADIYNTNGACFVRREGQPENYGTQSLTSLDSLQLKQKITGDLQRIRTETNAEVKSQLISDFSKTYFTSLSSSQTRDIEHMFTPENDKELAQFISSLNEANTAQATENELYQSQKDEIQKSNEKRIKYLISHAELSPDERLHFIDRYGQSILQSYSINGNVTHEKVEALIDSLPAQERAEAAQRFASIAQATQEKFDDLALIAKDQYDKTKDLSHLVKYQEEIIASSKDENFAFFSQCETATVQFLKSYTERAYNKSEEKFAKQFVFRQNNRTILPSATISAHELEIFMATKKFVDNTIENKETEYNKDLITYQELKNQLFEEYYAKDVAAAYIEDKKNDIGLNGIAPNSSLLVYSKNHSTEEIASRLAKQDILNFLEKHVLVGDEYTDEVKRLSKLSLTELATIIKLPKDKDGKTQALSVTLSDGERTIKRFPSKETSKDYVELFDKAQNATLYASACKGYQDVYIGKINETFNHINRSMPKSNVEIITNKNGKTIFKYKTFNPNGLDREEKTSLKMFVLRYPELKTFPVETQKLIVSTFLNSNYQYEKSFRETVTPNGKTPEQIRAEVENLPKIQNTYKMATDLALSVLRGDYQDALYHSTYQLAMGSEKLPATKDAANTLNRTINAHIHTTDVLEAFSEEQNKALKNFFNATAKASPHRSAASIIKEGLEQYVGSSELKTGEKFSDIVNRYFPAGMSDKDKVKAFEKFIAENKDLIKNQTELTATAYHSDMGKDFVDKEIKRQVKGIDDETVATYSNYVKLFTDMGIDKDVIAQTLAQADSFQSGVDTLLKEAGISDDEMKRYKIKRDQIKISQFDDSTKKLYKLYKKQFDIKQAYSSYIGAIVKLTSHEIDPSLNQTAITTLSKIDKDLLKKAGIDLDETLALISKADFSKEDLDKLSQIATIHEKQFNRASTRQSIEISREVVASRAVTKEDREAVLAKDDYTKYRARAGRFRYCFGEICEFIQNNPQNSEIDKILNAFVEGDREFFELNRVIGFEGVDDIDIAVFKNAGIDLEKIRKLGKIKNKDKLVKKLLSLNNKFAQQMAKEEEELKKKAKEKEEKAREEKDKKAKSKIDKQNKKTIVKDLPLLAKLFQRKADKEAAEQRAREAAQAEIENARAQARQENETNRETTESEAEAPKEESSDKAAETEA